MKKYVYLCGMMLLTLNMMAQIDLNDKNWDTLFIEDFSGNRSWNPILWEDRNLTISHYNPRWICFVDSQWDSGVTLVNHNNHKTQGYHAFQRDNAVFGADNTMKLVGEFKSRTPLLCGTDGYEPAPWHKYCHFCDTVDWHKKVHYFSGMIETIDTVGFGYYEVECKMPIHRGSHDDFWFWGDFGHYEEIDVFEHCSSFCDGDSVRGFQSAIFYNAYGPSLEQNPATGDPGATMYHLTKYHLPISSQPLDEYHTFGLEWLPDRVTWYCDGVAFCECTDYEHIPKHPMWMKFNHFQDDDIFTIQNNTDTIWREESDEMTINYVKAYRLKTDCNTDAFVRSLSDFSNFEYKVKHSITMGGQNNTTLAIPGTSNFTMRAVESITIDNAFEVPVGACMTLITQDCPKCSTEGVVLPLHNCGMQELEE